MWYQLVVLCFGPASYGDIYPATGTMGHSYPSGFLPILDPSISGEMDSESGIEFHGGKVSLRHGWTRYCSTE